MCHVIHILNITSRNEKIRHSFRLFCRSSADHHHSKIARAACLLGFEGERLSDKVRILFKNVASCQQQIIGNPRRREC